MEQLKKLTNIEFDNKLIYSIIRINMFIVWPSVSQNNLLDVPKNKKVGK